MVIKYNKLGARGIGSIRLLPGLNLNVDEKEWSKWENHPVIKIELESGDIEVMHRENKSSISSMKPKQALEHIETVTDVAVLEHYRTETSNKRILEKIDTQIAEIKAPVERRSDKKEE